MDTFINLKKGIEEEESLKKDDILMQIDYEIIDKLNSYYCFNSYSDPLTIFVKNKFEENDKSQNLTCRKLANDYYIEKGIKVSKSTINNIIHNRLGYRYLKTTIKNKIILSDENIIISLSFIKIIERCLRLKMTIIYVDETSILSMNNNYRLWRHKNQEIYFDIPKKERINLIMAIKENDVIHYSFNKENTNDKIFNEFMISLYNKIIDMKIGPYVIVMDNLSAHKTKKMINTYTDKKINIIFNSPYLSSFNSIDLAFRHLKKKINSQIYNNMDMVINNVKNIIESENFKVSLKKNFKDTITQYILFSEKYKYLNIKKLKSKFNEY